MIELVARESRPDDRKTGLGVYPQRQHGALRLLFAAIPVRHEPVGHRGQGAPVQVQAEGPDFPDDPQESVQVRIALLLHPRQVGADVDTVHPEL